MDDGRMKDDMDTEQKEGFTVDESPLTITIRKPWAGLVRNAALICGASEDDIVERFVASSAAYGAAVAEIDPARPDSHILPELQLVNHHLHPETAIQLFDEMKQTLIANAEAKLPSDAEVLAMRCEGES